MDKMTVEKPNSHLAAEEAPKSSQLMLEKTRENFERGVKPSSHCSSPTVRQKKPPTFFQQLS
jgi:hypothetical protein